MRSRILIAAVLVAPCLVALATGAQPPAVEVSDDGRETVILSPAATDGQVLIHRAGVPYGTAPDWRATGTTSWRRGWMAPTCSCGFPTTTVRHGPRTARRWT